MIEITELVVYPIKSLRGVNLTSVEVEKRGLRHDRRWMVVDEDGIFITARKVFRMAQIETAISDTSLTVTMEGYDSVQIPLEPEGGTRSVQVWNDVCDGQEVSDLANEWLSDVIGIRCSLIYMPDSTRRNGMIEGDIVAFSDHSPILVASQGSIDDLNSKLDIPIPIRRFRPNIVVKGCSPFEEDEWSGIDIGPVKMHRVNKSGRCLVTTLDIETATTSDEPLRTLATYRKDGNHVWFGCYYAPDSFGSISVGSQALISLNPG